MFRIKCVSSFFMLSLDCNLILDTRWILRWKRCKREKRRHVRRMRVTLSLVHWRGQEAIIELASPLSFNLSAHVAEISQNWRNVRFHSIFKRREGVLEGQSFPLWYLVKFSLRFSKVKEPLIFYSTSFQL